MNDTTMSGYDFRGTNDSGLSIEFAWNVGKAMADWLPTSGQVVVVRHGEQAELAHAVTEGLRLQGRAVLDGGVGDKEMVQALIMKLSLSGGVMVGRDELEDLSTIELYREDGKLVESESGLHDIYELVQAGNFVPAAVKGELTNLA